MISDAELAAELQARFPEGLTAVFNIGGTRYMYILENNRQAAKPGKIEDFNHYMSYSMGLFKRLVTDYLALGGKHFLITLLSHQLMEHKRGPEYTRTSTRLAMDLMNADACEFYTQHDIDPYFCGIDLLFRLPKDHPGYELAVACAEFNERWPYHEGHSKFMIEVAPIALYSIWRAPQVMSAEAQAELGHILETTHDLNVIYDKVTAYYTKALYGTDFPQPHLYIGNARNGDIKIRAMLPIALLGVQECRFYFTPYSTLFMPREKLKRILYDLVDDRRIRSSKIDYRDQLTPEIVQQEYQRIVELTQDPKNIIGLSRKVVLPDEE